MPKHFPPATRAVAPPDPKLLEALPTGRETVPIDRARRHLAAGLVEGTDCPVCGQRAQLYRRRIHATMARQLALAYSLHGTEPFHAPSLGIVGGDFAKLVHWGLIAESSARRKDGGRAGWWRITRDGERFLAGEARVPEFVLIYDGVRIGYDGDTIGLATVAGDAFDLRDVQATGAGDADRTTTSIPPARSSSPDDEDDDVASGKDLARIDAIRQEHGPGAQADAIIAGSQGGLTS